MKRIVLCADGTWNQAERLDKKSGKFLPTNVLKAARAIAPRSTTGVDQIVFYLFGVGTSGKWDELTGGSFGVGIEKNVRTLYRFLVNNYVPGDEIYLFGFSRGAFTVRTLAGFLNKVGLLHKEDEYYTPALYRVYESRAGLDSVEWRRAFSRVGERRPCPQLRFIGVWDTVGALGAPGLLGRLNKSKYQYHDIDLNDHVENAFHALAIDEHRKPFAPSLWVRPPGWNGCIEQVWFAGAHSNVGGGYTPDGLANEALHWMVEKAEGLGLEFNASFLANYLPCFNSILNDSMRPLFRVLGSAVRSIGQHAADGEALHQSVLDRIGLPECHYSPINVESYAKQEGRVVVNTRRVSRGTPCAPLP